MFAKANPKGMALFLHTLLCLFDDEAHRSLFSVCWFPYTMVELKEFKAIALQICEERLVGRLQPNVVTKAVLETASGVRMWQTLRTLSDYCVADYMKRNFNKV